MIHPCVNTVIPSFFDFSIDVRHHEAPEVLNTVREAVEELGYSHLDIHSGTGHDAQYISYMILTAMIFAPSEKGLSHRKPKHTSVELCTKAASVMLNAVLKCDKED